MKMRRAFITILAIAFVVGSVASCKKSSGAKQTIPVRVTQKSVDGIPREKLLGDFIYPEIGRFFKLRLSDDQTYRLETIFLPGSDDERVVAKTSGTWSIEKSVILLTPASTEGSDVLGDFVILEPDMTKEGEVYLYGRLKDDYGWVPVGFLRPEVLSGVYENMPNEIPETKPGRVAHR